MPKLTTVKSITTPMTPSSGKTNTSATVYSQPSKSSPPPKAKTATTKNFVDAVPPLPTVDPALAAARAAAARAYALSSITADSGGNKPRRRRNNNQSSPIKGRKRGRSSNNNNTPAVVIPTPPQQFQPNLPYATPPQQSFHHHHSSPSTMRPPWMPSVPQPPTNQYMPPPYNNHAAMNSSGHHHSVMPPAAYRAYHPPPKAKRKLATAPAANKKTNTTKRPRKPKGTTSSSKSSSQPRSIHPNLYPSIKSLPILPPKHNIDPDDEEYAKFVKSLISTPLDQPQTNHQNNPYSPSSSSLAVSNEPSPNDDDDDDDDEEEYQISASDEEDDDENDEDNDNEINQDEVDQAQKNPLSTNTEAATESASDQSNKKNQIDNKSALQSSSSSPISTRSNSINELVVNQTAAQSFHDQNNNNNNNTNAQQWLVGGNNDFYAELEAELGSLLEEDMEAAVSTLLNGKALLPGEKHHFHTEDRIHMSGLDGGTSNCSHTNQMDIQNTPTIKTKNDLDEPNITAGANIHHHDQSSNNSHPLKNNSVTFTSAIPVTTSPLSPLKDKHSDILAIGVDSSGQLPKSTSHLPPVIPHQIQELQDLMSHHYQLLLQQSIMAVRALHVNKLQKDMSIQKKITNSVKKESTATAKLSPVESQRNNRKKNEQQKEQPIKKEELLPTMSDNSVKARFNNIFFSGESPDDWAEILDGAVGMLQDLDQNRKDAIRYAILMEESAKRQRNKMLPKNIPISSNDETKTNNSNCQTLESNITSSDDENNVNSHDIKKEETSCRRIMTRSAFSRTLKERDAGFSIDSTTVYQSTKNGNDINNNSSSTSLLRSSTNSNGTDGKIPVGTTVFDVKGLALLKETFSSIDNSVRASSTEFECVETPIKGENNILEPIDHGDSCKILLRQACADYEEKFLPFQKDLSEYLSYPKEMFGENFKTPISKNDEITLRKSKFQFTAAEDNLLLMGINLYGEKEWSMISNRFLPDRSVSLISQRYAKLCVMIYKANGIKIDASGCLETPPEHPNGAEDFDEEKISKLSRVKAPTKFDVHRWSLEEDITLLKAVPLMGHMWAEVANRLIHHRDRGHLRKRYQVLERRVKATMRREKKLMNDRNELEADSNLKIKSDDTKKMNLASIHNQPKKRTKTVKMKKKQKPMPAPYPPVPEYARAVSHGFGAPPPGAPVMMMNPYVPSMMPMNMQNNMGPSVMVPPVNRHKHTKLPPQSKERQSNLDLRIKPQMALTGKFSAKQPDKEQSHKDQEHGEEELLCSEKIGSLLPEANGVTKHVETPQNSKMSSLKSLTVSQFSMSGSLSGFDARGLEASNAFDSTRMGFEKIINEGDDWSQMSRVKKLIENDTSPHSKVKSGISSVEGSNGPSIRSDKDIALLPCLEIYKSSSGLSVLNESQSSIIPTNAKSTKKNGSIMSEVLERVKENGVNKNESFVLNEKNHNSSATTRTNENNVQKSSPFITSNKTIGSIPSTPSANMTYGGGMSMDSFEFNQMAFSDRSRSTFKDGISPRINTHASPMNMQMAFSRPFQSCGTNAYSANSLMANDYEAITALNSMSNSSVNLSSTKPSKFKNSPKMMQKSKVTKKGKTSLFAKVVGGVKAKDEKKKEVKTRSK